MRAPTTSGDLLSARQRAAQLDRRAALDRLRPLLEDEAVREGRPRPEVRHVVLARHGIALRGLAFDSMLASYLLDATRLGPPARGDRRSSTSATRR